MIGMDEPARTRPTSDGSRWLDPQMLDSKMSMLNDKSSEGMILWQNDRTDHFEIEVISPTDPTVRPYYTNLINKQISILY